MHEIGVGREIGHPDRAERADGGCRTRVERLDERLRELGPNPGGPRGARWLASRASAARTTSSRQRRALPDTVIEDEQAVVLGDLGRVDGAVFLAPTPVVKP